MPLSIPNGPGGRSLRMEMVQQAEVFEKLVTQRPQWDLWFNRGHILAGRRDWPQAAKFYAMGVERFEEYAKSPENQTRMAKGSARNPNPLPFFLLNLAGAELLAGDEKGYLEICDRIQREADRIDGPTNTHHASRLLSLSPAEGIDRAAAVRLSEKAIKLEPKYTWFIYGLGLAHYRAGDYEKAMAKLEEHLKVDPNWEGIGQDYAVLAMTCHRRGQHDDACVWLKKAKAALENLEKTMEKERVTFSDGGHMNNWFELMILLSEAEKLVESDKK